MVSIVEPNKTLTLKFIYYMLLIDRWWVLFFDITANIPLDWPYLNESRITRDCAVFFNYSLLINDLPNCLTYWQPQMYADNTHIAFPLNNTIDIDYYINHYLTNVIDWLIASKVTLNS